MKIFSMESFLFQKKYFLYSLKSEQILEVNWPKFLKENWTEDHIDVIPFNVMPATGFDIVIFPSIVWSLFAKKRKLVVSSHPKPDLNNLSIVNQSHWLARFKQDLSLKDCINQGPFVERDTFIAQPKNFQGLFDSYDLADEACEINVVAFDGSDATEFNRMMNLETPPTVEQLLDVVHAFASVVFSMECGIVDSLTIMSRVSLELDLTNIIKSVVQRCENFEAKIDLIETTDELCKSLEDLTNANIDTIGIVK